MAMAFCPECRSTIPDHESFCPVCGHRMEVRGEFWRSTPPVREEREAESSAYPQPVGQPLGPVKVERTPADWKGRLGCLVVLLLFACLVALGSYLNNSRRSVYSPTKDDAYEIAVMNVKAKLKARSGVRFPSVSQVEATRSDPVTFVFRGSYYPKTSSGERTGKPFRVAVRWIGTGGYNLEEWAVVDMSY